MRYNILLLIFFLTFVSMKKSDEIRFEGSWELLIKTPKKTSFHKYYYCYPKIRIDKLDNNKNLLVTSIIDISTKEIFELNHKTKKYRKVIPSIGEFLEDYNTKKSKNSSEILNYKCEQWIAKNSQKEIYISYWVADIKFREYREILQMIKNRENGYNIFLEFDNPEGMFPLRIEKKNFCREFLGEYKVTNLKIEKPSASVFRIPADYEYFKI